jgi:hypothetical protein
MVVGSIVLASAAAALHQSPTRAREPRLKSLALPSFEARCRVQGSGAHAHARALEQGARLHWQRAPFAHAEALRAVQQIAQAEVCYRADGDRARALHAATMQRRYRAELARQHAMAQLRDQGHHE